MPEQKGPLYFSGKLGNIVGYSRNGKHYYRSLPQHVEISKAAKLSGTDFGTASKAGKLIRNAIKPQLDIPFDDQHGNRLNKILLKILYAGSQPRGSRSFQNLDLSGLTGYKFNVHSKIDDIVTEVGIITHSKGNFHMAIPKLQIESILHRTKASHIEIKVIAVSVNLIENTCQAAVKDQVLIDLSSPAPSPLLYLPTTPHMQEEMIIVMQTRVFVKTKVGLQPSKKAQQLAAAIIYVYPSAI